MSKKKDVKTIVAKSGTCCKLPEFPSSYIKKAFINSVENGPLSMKSVVWRKKNQCPCKSREFFVSQKALTKNIRHRMNFPKVLETK